MIRLIFLAIFAIIVVILSLVILPVLWIIGRFNKDLRGTIALKCVHIVFNIVLFISGVKTTVKGVENIPKDEAVLFVGNHHSIFDIIITYPYMKRPTGFVAKKETDKILLLNVWMRFVNCLFLDRDNIKEGLKTILAGIEKIKKGTSLVIFPEGTRNKSDEGILPFHAGSLKLAEKSGCKIIPMVQNNTAAIFEDHIPFLKRTHTVLEFGEPIDISTLSADEKKSLSKDLQALILSMYNDNKSLL